MRNDGYRNLAVLAGGIAAGIFGARMLPPLLAAMRGRQRAKTGDDPFARLIDDHRKILATIDKMIHAPADERMNRARLFLTLKRKLAKHAMAEEDVVYPQLHEGEKSEESKHLYEEHANMKILLFELEQCLKTKRDWRDIVRSLRDLVQRHVDEEETTAFPHLRARMHQRGSEIAGQIYREEALIL